jgi:biotin transporter BioY
VLRSVLMSLLAFVIWAVLGVGLGVLIRSQLGATLTGAFAYLLSFVLAFAFFGLIRQFVIKEDWVWNWMVSVPGVASQVMISAEPLQFGPNESGPQWWVGALVLIGYGILAGVVGTLITRKRDIS